MKNKIAKKLIFSAVALGASVLTLTTTTYAWYVQNNTVTATNITAQTASNSAGSLFISKDGRPRVGALASEAPISWGPTIAFDPATDFTAETKAAFENERNAFTPITYYAGTTTDEESPLYDKTGKFIDANATVQTDKTLTVTFFLLSNKDGVTVQPTLTVQNTTGDAKVAQTAYAAISKKVESGQPAENLVNENEQFWVDAVQALRMKVKTEAWDTTNEAWGNTTNTFYDVLEVAKKPKAVNATTFEAYELATFGGNTVKSITETELGTETISSSNYTGAHAYYRRFVGGEPKAGFTETNTTAIAASTSGHAGKMSTLTVGTNVLKVTVTIWLEGTDVSCFDSCSGQTFNFGFDFTVSSNS
ncbi:MAG: hypothetical protein IJU60_02600 [Acholeplasmatales bacterium]|nr:hypothetical protein [Acholeplasmatales bacterium]